MSGRERAIGTDFTRGNITLHLIRFMLPLLLAGVLNSLYNAIDTIVIGQFAGTAGNVAVSTGGKVLLVMTIFSNSMAGAGQVVLGQRIGEGRREEVNKTIGTLFCLLGMMAAAACAALLLFSRSLITALNTPENAFDGALGYMRITSLGMPLIFGYNASCCVLRGMGDSRRPLLFIAIAAVVNLVLDLVFVAVLHAGAVGTAWATVIAQGASFVFAVLHLYRRKERFGFDFRLKSFVPEGKTVKLILKIGVPMSATGLFISVTQVFMQGFINACGEIQAAAYNVADKVLTMENVFSSGIQQAGSTIVAQDAGAGKADRIRGSVRSGLILSVPMAIAASVAVIAWPEQLFHLFIQNEEILAYAPRLMRLAAVTFVISAVNCAFDSVTVGTGFAALKMAAGFLDGVVLRVSVGLYCGLVLDMGVVGFFFGHCFARLAPLVCNLIYYFSGRWKNRKLT